MYQEGGTDGFKIDHKKLSYYDKSPNSRYGKTTKVMRIDDDRVPANIDHKHNVRVWDPKEKRWKKLGKVSVDQSIDMCDAGGDNSTS